MSNETPTVKYTREYGKFKLTFETTNGIHIDIIISRYDAVKLHGFLDDNLDLEPSEE